MKYLQSFYRNHQQHLVGEIRKSITNAGVWFVDIPRTSSTSIKWELKKAFGDIFSKTFDRETRQKNKTLLPDHLPSMDIVELIGKELWDDIFTFSVVRNPWARFLSLYKFRIAAGDLPQSITFESYVKMLPEITYRRKHSPYSLPHYHMSMCDFLLDSEDNLLVNKFYKMEDRQQLIMDLFHKLGISISNTHKEKLSDDSSYRISYTNETKKIVGSYYLQDIEFFGYDF